MTDNLSARRGALIAAFSALALLVLIGAFDNQGTRTWRIDQMSGNGGDTARSWTAGPVQALSVLDWRATPDTDEPTRFFLGYLAAAVLTVVFTFLLIQLVCRGVAAGRGRWALFAGSWFATGAAAGLAVVAGSAIAGASLSIGAVDPNGTRFTRGDTYYQMLNSGLLFGLFAGWLVGLVAIIAYGITEDADEEAEAPAYTSPFSGYEYGSTTPSSGSNYSFSPGSPYSSPAPDHGNRDSNRDSGDSDSEEPSPSAPTQPIVPPQENDPYGGGNRSY